MPYRGSARSSTQSSAPPAPVKSTTNGAAPAKPVAAKTGYLAILERAKAAQDAAKQQGHGQIKHQRTEKLSRRERDRLLAEAASKNKSVPSNDGRSVARSTKVVAGTQKVDGTKKERQPVDVGYKGTMRPVATSQSSYRGTMGLSLIHI